MYSITNENDTKWCSKILNILNFIDLKELYDNMLSVNIDTCRTLLLDKQRDQWITTVLQKPKLRFYALFKDTFKPEKYVELSLSSYERSVLAHIRFGF